MTDQHPVGKDSDAFLAAEEKRKLPRTQRGGQSAMRAATTDYLPAFPGESTTDPTEYPARLARSTYFPFINEAVGFAVGQVFAKEVELGEDVPSVMTAWAEDIDRRGNNLHVFAAAIFEDYWWLGAGVWLVDMPPLPVTEDGAVVRLSRADAETAGRRPFWVRYEAGDVRGWRWEVVAGRRRLAFLKVEEVARAPVDEYGGESTERRRRCFWAAPVDGQGRATGTAMHEEWALRKVGEAQREEWVLLGPRSPLLGQTEIPAVILGALEDGSPLQTLAELNLSHWQRQSDVDNIEHVANVPIPYVAGGGLNKDSDGNRVPLKWAVNTLMELDQGATAGYIEHSGACIAEAKKSLEKLEAEMGRRAMRSLLEAKPAGSVTATSDIITSGRSFSALQFAALKLQDALELGLIYTARYGGEEKSGSVEVNRKFLALPADALTLEWVKWLREQGLLSGESAFAEAQRHEKVSEGLTYEDEQERIAKEGPALGTIAGDPWADPGEDEARPDDEEQPAA